MPKTKYKYDIFLSHNSKDKPAVRQFAEKLRSLGLKPFLDEDDLIPGANWQNELEAAVQASSTTAVFISKNRISPWEEAEMQVAISQQRQDKTRRVIPVLLPGKYKKPDVPAFLGLSSWVDFRKTTIADDETFSRLLAGIYGITSLEARTRFGT